MSELIDLLLADARERMGKSVESIRQKFGTVRTGRASPALLDRIMVDYYGTQTPLKQLATISAPEPRLLSVQAYDKSSVKSIEKAIMESDVGLTPNSDGALVRLAIPELTEERRRAGADNVKARLRDAVDFGLDELTVYSFSTENWARAPEEVAALMRMHAERIDTETPELHQEGVRMRFIGRREGIEPHLVER